MEKIIIVGGKGTAVNIAEHIIDARTNYNSKQEFIGFAIDDESLGREINGFPVLCKTNEIKEKFKSKETKIIFALYRPDVMKERVDLLEKLDIEFERFTNFVHPLTYISPSTKIGIGNAILSNASIQSNVKIGNFNIINSNVVVEHDTFIGSNNFIAASVCIGAKVNIQNGNFIGLNSSVREFINMSNYCFLGMGSNLLTDLFEGKVSFGNPAKIKQ